MITKEEFWLVDMLSLLGAVIYDPSTDGYLGVITGDYQDRQFRVTTGDKCVEITGDDFDKWGRSKECAFTYQPFRDDEFLDAWDDLAASLRN